MEIDAQMAGILSAVIVGLVQVAKSIGLPAKWSALVAVCLGVLGGFLWLSPGDWRGAVLGGIIAGLTASGLYSGGKATAEAVRGDG